MMITSSTILTREICRNYIEESLFGPAHYPSNLRDEHVKSIGVERECFPFMINDQNDRQPVRLFGNGDSLSDILIHYSEMKGGVARYKTKNLLGKNNDTIIEAIDFPDGCNFQFEPGAQVEISTSPSQGIDDLSCKLNFMQQILHEVSRQTNFRFVQCGTHPWFTTGQIGMQLNKPRYRAMSRYFEKINEFGSKMLVQTCSLQVNVDTGCDWDTRVKRFVAANLLAPFATALFAHSPVTAGKINGYKSYRSFIWQQLDQSRTGLITANRNKNSLDKDALIDAYLRFALNAPVVFIEDFGDETFPANITLEYWITNPVNGLQPTLAHFKNHLSLLFPEVRLKGYLELRSADAPPPEWQMIPVLFYCGLLYSNHCLEKTLDLLLPFRSELPSLMQQAVFGLEQDDIFKTAKKLMPLAIEGFSGLPESFRGNDTLPRAISFLENYCMQRKTFADDFLEEFVKKKNRATE
ncbi:MAG: hypothetical protein IT214_09170 [Chitinophagaceae bacterium]|nr:hypothetical protein [Chitinophagaceae bacterium]